MIGGMRKHGRYSLPAFVLASLLLSALALVFGACSHSDGPGPPAHSAARTQAAVSDALQEKAGIEADEIRAADLPPEARHTLARIKANGPFPFPKDGSVFGNRERLLPAKPRGYYREYTVITPGSRDRGARRIVAGRDEDYYYTDDHYGSFKRIRE
jgi:ribonuclease T1